MPQLIEKPELAGELREYLEQQADKGHEWVVYDTDNPISSLRDLHCFPDEEEALAFGREIRQIWNWHEAVPISDLLFTLKEMEHSQKHGLRLNLFEFSDLSDYLKEAGYPGNWVNSRLMENIPYYASDFIILELMEHNGDQAIIKLDFDISKGSIRLEQLTARLLKVPATKEQVSQLADEPDNPLWRDKWLAAITTSKELIPVSLLFDTLLALKNKDMNKNNLDDLKTELRELRFPKEVIGEMEKNMEKNLPQFQVRHQRPGDKGQVDMILHFKQSGQSDYYYFNKYNVTLNNAKPLADGHQYLVISQGEKDKPVFRKFVSPQEAITYFKEQKGSSELAAGKIDKKELAFKSTLATMEKDKVNFVDKDFNKIFYTPIVTQTVYVEKGQGFTAEQSANMLQNRAVHRDNLLNLGGETFKAWIELDFDKPKDRFKNYKTRQYHDPSYVFNLQKTLDRYNIKELADPVEREKIEESMRNGNRPLVTTIKDGKEVKMKVTALPRYNELNFHDKNDRPEKREQFMTPKAIEELAVKKAGREKELDESMGIGR